LADVRSVYYDCWVITILPSTFNIDSYRAQKTKQKQKNKNTEISSFLVVPYEQ
jgi:hypothetical protein